jgi:hypothetical protein
MAETLDAVLKQRLRAFFAGGPCTEAELRKLFEEGRACTLIMGAQLDRAERELAELDSDPESSITDLAAAVRRVNELRPDLAELTELLRELEARARSYRAAWLGRNE